MNVVAAEDIGRHLQQWQQLEPQKAHESSSFTSHLQFHSNNHLFAITINLVLYTIRIVCVYISFIALELDDLIIYYTLSLQHTSFE